MREHWLVSCNGNAVRCEAVDAIVVDGCAVYAYLRGGQRVKLIACRSEEDARDAARAVADRLGAGRYVQAEPARGLKVVACF